MRERRTKPRAPRNVEESAARYAAQREELLHAAQRAIRRHGAGISMEDVAAEAGISRPILYRHFGDRRGLAYALRDAVFGAMLGLTAASGSDRRRHMMEERLAALYPKTGDADQLLAVLSGWVTGFASFVEANRELYRFLRREGVLDDKWDLAPGEWREPVAESLGASLETILASQSVAPETARTWGYALVGMVGGAIEWWAVTQDRDRLEMERDLGRLAGATLRGLTAPQRRTATRGGARRKRRTPARRRSST